MASPVSSLSAAGGVLVSYTYSSVKQATAVRSALDKANNSASHKEAVKAVATLSGTNLSSSQTAANKALITMSALVDATDSTQKLIMAAKARSAYGAASNSFSAGTGSAGAGVKLST